MPKKKTALVEDLQKQIWAGYKNTGSIIVVAGAVFSFCILMLLMGYWVEHEGNVGGWPQTSAPSQETPGAGDGTAELTPEASAPREWKTYRNDEYNYEIDYPSNFKIQEGASGIIIDKLFSEDTCAKGEPFFFCAIRLHIGVGIYPKGLQQYYETREMPSKEFNQIIFSGINAFERTGPMLGGSEIGNGYLQQRKIIFEIDGNEKEIYEIAIEYPRALENELEVKNNIDIFNQMLSTFKLTGKDKKNSNLFELDKIRAGDEIAGMTVRVVDGAPYGRIYFSGEAEITGSYDYYGEDQAFFGGLVCMRELNEQSLAKLPKNIGDARNIWFCFSNQDLAKTELGPIGSSGLATVTIDNYVVDNRESEVWNVARLINVMNKTNK